MCNGLKTLAGIAFLLVACGPAQKPSSEGSRDTEKPRLVFHAPAMNARGVTGKQPVFLEFSEPMALESLSFRWVPEPAVAAVKFGYLGTVVRLEPANEWAANTDYELTLAGADLAGNTLDLTRIRFSTQPGSSNCPTPGQTFDNCGASCVACDPKGADACVNGACSCGTLGQSCASDKTCVNGLCVPPCNATTCSQGCCENGLCYAPAGSGQATGGSTSATRCGINGAVCLSGGLGADACSPAGELLCGGNSYCVYPQSACLGGACNCPSGGLCGSSCCDASEQCLKCASRNVEECRNPSDLGQQCGFGDTWSQ